MGLHGLLQGQLYLPKPSFCIWEPEMKTCKPVKYRYIFFFMTTILSHVTGWMIEESGFNFLQRQQLYLFFIACRASYPMGTGSKRNRNVVLPLTSI
jgi:hypothetical protein